MGSIPLDTIDDNPESAKSAESTESAKSANPADCIHILQAVDGSRLAKRFTWAEGAIAEKTYDNAMWFVSGEAPVRSLEELVQALEVLGKSENAVCCVIRGRKLPSAPKRFRRLLHPRDDAAATIEDVPRSWLLLDSDSVALPSEMQKIVQVDPATVISWFVSRYLPPELQGVSVTWQMSSSMGVPTGEAGEGEDGWRKLKTHLWFLLAEPHDSAELKRWAQERKLIGQKGTNIIDGSVFNAAQIHYTAAPICVHMKDPVQKRIGVLREAHDTAHLEIPPENQSRAPRESRTSRTTPPPEHAAAPLITKRRKQAADRLRASWPRAGDGYHETLLAATGSIARLGWGRAEIDEFITRAAPGRSPPEPKEISNGVDHTLQLLKQGKPATGWPQLSRLVGSAVDEVMDLLDVPRPADHSQGTELGNARGLIRANPNLRHCTEVGGWLTWDGQHWMTGRAAQVRVAQLADSFADSMLRAAEIACTDAEREQIATLPSSRGNSATRASPESSETGAARLRRAQVARKWARRTMAVRGLEAMTRRAATQKGVTKEASDLDANPMQLGTKNGTVDLTSGIVTPAKTEDLITKVTGADCPPLLIPTPLWDAFLKKIFDEDESLIAFAQRFVGYAITGEPTEEVLAIFHGTGANGKSTFINVLSYVLGNYFRQVDSDVLLPSRNGSSKTEAQIAQLRGVRLACCAETGQARRIDEALMKKLASTDELTGKLLYSQPVTFKPSHQMVLLTNHRPIVKTTDEGTWRRILLVPFAVTIPELERNRNLANELRKEASGILRWAIEGCLAWQAGGLRPCQAVLAATGSYRDEEDWLGSFLKECIVEAAGATCTTADLYGAYVRWSSAAGVKLPLTRRRFTRTLRERGALTPTRVGDSRGYEGIKVLTGRVVGGATDEVAPDLLH